MATTGTVPRDEHTAKQDDLYMSLELGDKQWKLCIGDGRRGVSRYAVAAGIKAAVADCIAKAGARFNTPPISTA